MIQELDSLRIDLGISKAELAGASTATHRASGACSRRARRARSYRCIAALADALGADLRIVRRPSDGRQAVRDEGATGRRAAAIS